MGVSLSWIAVKGHSPEEVHEVLGARPTGRHEDFYRSPFSAVELPNGFFLVLFKKKELKPAELKTYSLKFDLLYCFVEEHVMYSAVGAWAMGKELWSVVHDAQEGILHLKVNGSPPAVFGAIRDRLIAQQKSEDMKDPEVDHVFEIPVALAKEMTGYRYDQESEGLGPGALEVLELIQKKGLARWNPFGS